MIFVKGGSERQRELAMSMAEFCVKKLMPRMKSLEVNIVLKDFGKDSTYGYALPADEADTSRPRQFDVEINKKVKLRRMLETVAHEMVHVKQFARGELYESVNLGMHRWKGKWLSNSQQCVKDYWDHPWEIEAHGRETGLFIRWAEANDLAKYKWTQLD